MSIDFVPAGSPASCGAHLFLRTPRPPSPPLTLKTQPPPTKELLLVGWQHTHTHTLTHTHTHTHVHTRAQTHTRTRTHTRTHTFLGGVADHGHALIAVTYPIVASVAEAHICFSVYVGACVYAFVHCGRASMRMRTCRRVCGA